MGTNAATTKPASIAKFVNQMNHLLRVPDSSSPVLSEQPTDPAGYSPPITDSKEKSIRSKCSEHAVDATMSTIRASSKSGEDKLAKVSDSISWF
jgi:hypothetical protein